MSHHSPPHSVPRVATGVGAVGRPALPCAALQWCPQVGVIAADWETSDAVSSVVLAWLGAALSCWSLPWPLVLINVLTQCLGSDNV